jgi:hypothetical protein
MFMKELAVQAPSCKVPLSVMDVQSQLTLNLILMPGERAIIYFQMAPGTLTTLDAGASTTLNIFAGEAGAPLSTIIQNP